ncbi:MAG: phosphate ABC transporter permease subunit PstC [Pseudomonadota bacterium]
MTQSDQPLSEWTNKAYRRARWEQMFVHYLFLAISSVTILTTIGIIATLAIESQHFFSHVTFGEFLTGTKWEPLFEPKKFGVLPILWGTMMIAFGACVIAVPIGVGIALYLSEYAHPKVRATLKPLIELLAGIPSVVFGYFAVTIITPFLQRFLPSTEVFNAASAALTVGIMIIPVVASLSEDAFRSVPQSMRDAGYALGATPFEVNLRVVIPAAVSGIMASVILAFARAIGETMAVSLAAGSSPNLTLNFLEPIQTMTGFIVQVSMGDVQHGSIEYQSLFAVAGMLFIVTMIFNNLARKVVTKMKQAYE